MHRWHSWYLFFIGFVLGFSFSVVISSLSLYAFAYFSNSQAQNVPPIPTAELAQPSPPNIPTPTPMSTPKTTPPAATKYGHFRYAEVSQSRLIVVASYGQKEYQRNVQMEREAGLALFKLINTARDQGVWIIPISGFRTVDYQADLFNRQVKKQGSEIAAARISAPPGYSEHHTGLAIDLGDGFAAGQGIPDITEQFGKTRAYEWLRKNAVNYGFELSYLPNNPQGVMYEPWHWRYVGSEYARQVFAQARSGLRS